MGRYTIGIDYGTLSARALLLNLDNGEEIATSEFTYPHGVLQADFFAPNAMDKAASLEHPQDYLDALAFVIRDVLTKSGVDKSQVCGMGIDFTACTVLPVTKDGTPLCFLEEFVKEPQAYVKLWNSFTAIAEAERITQVATQENAPWLKLYSGKVSAEWLFPKLYEMLNKAPQAFEKTGYYMEAADWLTWMLTGNLVASTSFAGFKALWNPQTGHPGNNFWAKVDPRLDGIIGTKIHTNVQNVGSCAGGLNEYGAQLTGLAVGTPVALPIIDTHAPMCSAGAVGPGQVLMSLGTSAGIIVMDKELRLIDGIFGSIENGILPGLTTYAASQPSLGNTFAWFVKNCVPADYKAEADSRNISIFQLLDEKASQLPPGSNGLLALDWWSGNRAPYNDFNLSGMILGLTLNTKPEEIYRAIIESCAYATRLVLDVYRGGGIAINDIRAGGGISRKNPMLMQIYADVMGMPIRITDSAQPGCKGGCIFAAVVSGVYPDVMAAAKALADRCKTVYYPDEKASKAYGPLYEHYRKLAVYFAEGENSVMKYLHSI